MNGIVKVIEEQRGFCFLEPLIGKPGDTDLIFCHVSQCPGRVLPPVGCEVRFSLVKRGDGAQAAGVRLVEVSVRRVLREGPPAPA